MRKRNAPAVSIAEYYSPQPVRENWRDWMEQFAQPVQIMAFMGISSLCFFETPRKNALFFLRMLAIFSCVNVCIY
jgi:hypothetical protein